MTDTVTVDLTKKQVTAVVLAVSATNMIAKENGHFDEMQLYNAEQFLKEWQRILDMFDEDRKMNKQIKELKWLECNLTGNSEVTTLAYEYVVLEDSESDGYMVNYYNLRNSDPAKPATGFATREQAKEWAFNHHCEKMAKWLNPDPLSEYVNKFAQWSKDRRIIQNGNLQAQGLKLISEIGELADNMAKGRDTKDDIGDCFVVLNNLVEMQGYTWQECLAQAWNDIKDRKGHMNENGVFVKEGDTDD